MKKIILLTMLFLLIIVSSVNAIDCIIVPTAWYDVVDNEDGTCTINTQPNGFYGYDATITSGLSGKNFGVTVSLNTYANTGGSVLGQRILIRIPNEIIGLLQNPNNYSIENASLITYSFDGQDSPTPTWEFFTITNEWHEGHLDSVDDGTAVSWDDRINSTSWDDGGGDNDSIMFEQILMPSFNRWVTANITHHVREIQNGTQDNWGIMIKVETEGVGAEEGRRIYSSDEIGNADKRPIFNITYTPIIDLPPIIVIQEPDNNTNTNIDISIIINVTEPENEDVNCYLERDDSTQMDNIINITKGVNQSLNTTGLNQGDNVLNILCGDANTNTTEQVTIFFDSILPNITFITPSVNGTTFVNDFTYNITVSDANLFFTNVTIINSTGDIVYTNSTSDWNLTDIDLSDFIDVVDLGSDMYDICILVKDAHTDYILSPEFNHYVSGTTLNIKGKSIIYDGDIKQINTVQKTDKLQINLQLNSISEYNIILDECFNKVSRTNYYGHYVCLNENLWYDTNPFEVTYSFKDIYDRWVLVMNPTTKNIIFESAGEINIKEECLNFDVDVVNPLISLRQPENDFTTNKTTINFIYNVTHPPPPSMDNCTISFNGVDNETDTSIMLSQNQSFNIVGFGSGQTASNISWTVNCTDDNNHISHNAEIWNIIFLGNPIPEINVTITTAQSIENVGNWIITFILILIWLILLLVAKIFGGDWFIFGVGLFGIAIFLNHDFNGIDMYRAIFFIFNLMILLYSGMSINETGK